MSIKNKFDVTAQKFYLVFNDNDTTADKNIYSELFNGSISDYLGFKSYPMVMYAGKAKKHLQRTIDSAASIIEKPFFSPDGDNKTIASCSVALNELKKYNYYDLVGVYQVDSVYKVVDYKRVSELVQKECGYRLIEIPKELYIKLSVVKNIRTTREENKRKAKEKTQEYNKNMSIHAHTEKQDNIFVRAAKKFTSFITDAFLTFIGLAVMCAVVAIPICLASAAFEFLIK